MNEVTLSVPAEIYEALTTRAQRRGISVNQFLENMLSETRDLIDDFPDEELATPDESRKAMEAMRDRVMNRTPDQIKADQERIFRTLQKGSEYSGRILPEVVSQKSQLGAETGEEIHSSQKERS